MLEMFNTNTGLVRRSIILRLYLKNLRALLIKVTFSVLASILNDYEVPADSLVSRLKEWFDEVTYNKVEQ